MVISGVAMIIMQAQLIKLVIDVVLSRKGYDSSLERLLHSQHETFSGRNCLFAWCPPF